MPLVLQASPSVRTNVNQAILEIDIADLQPQDLALATARVKEGGKDRMEVPYCPRRGVRIQAARLFYESRSLAGLKVDRLPLLNTGLLVREANRILFGHALAHGTSKEIAQCVDLMVNRSLAHGAADPGARLSASTQDEVREAGYCDLR